MKVFLDTSSLLKLYHDEVDSSLIRDALSKNVEEIFLSELAILEFRSAVWKKIRTGELDEETGEETINCFQYDYDHFQWVRLQSEIVERASNLLMKYGKEGLRTLDSLQLASALTLKDKDCTFITSDNLLKSLFIKENLSVI